MLHKRPFITLLVITNLLFVFMLIYKQTWITRLSYKQQEVEKKRNELIDEKEALTQALYRLKNPKNVKKYAMNHLGMKKMSLQQAKKLSKKEIEHV